MEFAVTVAAETADKDVVPDKVVIPDTVKLVVVNTAAVALPETIRLPPTVAFLVTPNPPVVLMDPVFTDVLSVELTIVKIPVMLVAPETTAFPTMDMLFTVVLPVTFKVAPMFTLFETPSPPVVTKLPVKLEVDSAIDVTVNAPIVPVDAVSELRDAVDIVAVPVIVAFAMVTFVLLMLVAVNPEIVDVVAFKIDEVMVPAFNVVFTVIELMLAVFNVELPLTVSLFPT